MARRFRTLELQTSFSVGVRDTRSTRVSDMAYLASENQQGGFERVGHGGSMVREHLRERNSASIRFGARWWHDPIDGLRLVRPVPPRSLQILKLITTLY